MKKALFFVVLASLTLCSCGNAEPQKFESSSVAAEIVTQKLTDVPTEAPNEELTEPQTEAPTEGITEPPQEETTDDVWEKKVLFDEPLLIYDVNDLKIYQRGMGIAEGDLEIAILVENNTPYNVLLVTKYSSVDDFAADDICRITIPSGKKINDVIGFTAQSLERTFIKANEVSKVEFVFNVYDNDEVKHLEEFDSDPVIIEIKE